MSDNRRTAAIVGSLFIVGTVAGVLSRACTSAVLGSADSLARISTNGNAVILGALFVLVMGFALAMVPAMLFPIFRRRNEALALAYVVFRGALETVTYIAAAAIWLTLVALSRESAAAGAPAAPAFQAAGVALRNAADASQLMTIFAFGTGAAFFYWLLYQSRLIPRWLPVWGFVAIAFHLATGFLQLFGVVPGSSTLQTAMNLPIFLQEMVMAVWMIARGFDSTAAVTAPA